MNIKTSRVSVVLGVVAALRSALAGEPIRLDATNVAQLVTEYAFLAGELARVTGPNGERGQLIEDLIATWTRELPTPSFDIADLEGEPDDGAE